VQWPLRLGPGEAEPDGIVLKDMDKLELFGAYDQNFVGGWRL
jgi:hypothetical protein